MNKYLGFIFCFLLFTTTSNAQYTNIINTNRPGYTETPYAVGTNVYQFENTLLFNQLNNNDIITDAYSNDFNFRYGFWKEQLEASLNHKFTYQTFDNSKIVGTEILSVGLKYLIYHHLPKETPARKKSWKRRYGFKYNGLIPSVAAKIMVNTPLTNLNFNNGGNTTFSASIITQNQINQKIRINNQFDYNYIGGDLPEFIYAISASHVVAKRFNPYVEVRYQHNNKINVANVGVGTPFLISRDFSVAVHYNASISKNIFGNEFGVHAAYRIDNHYDRWEYIDEEEEEKLPAPIIRKKTEKKEEAFINETLLEEKGKTKEEILDEYFKQQDEELKRLEEQQRKEEEERLKREEKERKKKEKEQEKSKKRRKRKVKKKELDDVILSY